MTERPGFLRQSFQFKLALLSTLVSGLVLAVCGVVIWHYIEEAHRQRLDREMSDLAFQLLVSERNTLDQLHLVNEPLAVYGEELQEIGTLLQDEHGDEHHASQNWPPEFPLSQLTVPLDVKDYEPTHRSHGVRDGHDGNAAHANHTELSEHSEHSGHTELASVKPRYETVRHDGDHWRVVGLRREARTLHLVVNLQNHRSNLHHIRTALVLALGLAMVVSALGGWWVARRALRPMQALSRTAEGITATDLGRRIGDEGADREFARLIEVFNGMLERLDGSFQQAVRFSADASHELKTPLTVMQGEVESALQAAPANSDEQRIWASQLEEIQRLKHLVGKLLLMSQADSGTLRPARTRVDLGDLARQVCDDIPILGPDLEVTCRLENSLTVQGDAGLLRQVLQNLAVNAVRHNQPGGWVRWELFAHDMEIILRAANSAAPIPADLHERIFDRFFRVDASRTGGSTGLGLSLAREIARAHGGSLALVSSDTEGTVFELRLARA